MTRTVLREVAAWLPRFVIGASLFVGAQYIAPPQGRELAGQARPSSKAKGGTQSKSQRVTNPLNDLLDEAQHDIDNKQFENAIAPLQKVITEQPEFAYAHFQLAYVYTALEKKKEAQAEYERTIELDPKMGEAYLNLGLLLAQSDSPGAEPQFARAVPSLRKAVELMPGQKPPLYELAIAQQRSGDAAGAAESFHALLRLDPDDLDANVFVGGELLWKNKPQEAEARFRHALEHHPNFPPALWGLAESFEAQKKTKEAIQIWRQYIDRIPNRDIRARIVRLLMEQQQYDAALAELDRVPPFVLGNPDDPIPPLESLKLRADILIAQKKWDDSVATLHQALALAPNDAQLHGGLGRIFLEKRDFAAAEKELRIALGFDGKNLAYWKDLSSVYFLGGNYPAAIATLDEVAKVEPPGAGAWFIRAICYDKLNQPKPALAAYQKFIELEQDKNSNQFWQAQERSKVLRHMLERKR